MAFWTPQPGPQARAAICPADFTFFGGSRGGGKSDCLWGRQLRGAEKYKNRWNGIIIRRKYKEFAEMRRRINGMIADGLPAERIGGDQQTNYIRFANGAQVIMPAIQNLKMADDHVGQQYTEIGIDECTTFPFFYQMVEKLKGSCRSPYGVPSRMFGTGNPGGAGHNQVKQFFKLGVTFGVKPETVITDEDGQTRIFIPSFLDDNKILCDQDPQYVNRLKSIRDPALRAAWLKGDWDVYIGQAFLLTEAHIIHEPYPKIPESAWIYNTFDWGYGKPFSMGWWWVDNEGRGFRFMEWYGCEKDSPDTGLRITDKEIVLGKTDETGNRIPGIIEREKEAGIWGREHMIRLAGPDCWNKKPDYKGGGQGPSTAETFAALKIYLTHGDPSRMQKIQQFRERLNVPRDTDGNQIDRPMLQVYDKCRHFIATIPALSMDEDNPEDIDTDQEDHIYDEACHFCMARPIALKLPEKKKLLSDIHIDAIEKKQGDGWEEYAVREQQIQEQFLNNPEGRNYSDVDGR